MRQASGLLASVPLRIATFNVLFGAWDSWAERRPLVARAIERTRADVLGLQEVFPSQLANLADVLGDLAYVPGPSGGAARGFDRSPALEVLKRAARLRLPRLSEMARALSERAAHGEHQPIAYRGDRLRPLASGAFWISSTPTHPGSKLPLALAAFLVHWVEFERLDGTEALLVFNAHFGHAPWHYTATQRTVTSQLQAVVDARAAAAGAASGQRRRSVFLIGDFNCLPSSPLVRGLLSPSGAGFTDAVRSARARVGPPVTFHWGRGATRLGLALDYVLARHAPGAQRAEVVDAHEGRRYPSDHHPLVVEF